MKITIAHPTQAPTQLNVEIKSRGELGRRPVAFILPGGPGADHLAYLKYECLHELVDLVFHDPRGCGQSDKGDATTYTMTNYIDDVEAIRRELRLDKIIVIGKSYGSMCALGYALRYPNATKKLVLAAGAPSYRFLEIAKKNIKQIGSPEQIQICEKLWSGTFASSDELLRYFELTQTLYSIKSRAEFALDLKSKIQHFSYEVLINSRNSPSRTQSVWLEMDSDSLLFYWCFLILYVSFEYANGCAASGDQTVSASPEYWFPVKLAKVFLIFLS